jgi:threonine synthase
MRYFSTRGGAAVDLDTAIMQGLAPDGGLFVPDTLPRWAPADFRGSTVAEIGAELLSPFFAETPHAQDLPAICADAFSFPIPLTSVIPDALEVLELYHGPTAAFKDIGARFLAAVMERILARQGVSAAEPVTVLVATSGDTGSAVAAAFHGRSGIRVAVLYPKGLVSPRQQHQLTCWGGNVRAFEVDGTFDDCQALVKAAFTDESMRQRFRLTAANSINLGRLLPQCVYHAAASLWHQRSAGSWASFIVPCGNLGNGLACLWARAMGLPIGDIVLATNANRVVPDYLATGDWQPRASRPTLASAMDVGNPSNMERLRYLIPDFAEQRRSLEAYPVDDDAIRQQIAHDFRRYGRIWCPHTATALWAYDQLPEARRSAQAWIAVATAHPAKFEQIVEPIIGQGIEVPPALAELLSLPTQSWPLSPALGALRQALSAW